MTSLGLLVIVGMGLAAAIVLSVVLMFLVKNIKVQKICFYIVAALGVYMGTVGIRIMLSGFWIQLAIAIALMLVSVGAIVLERKSKDNAKLFLYAKILAAVAAIAGFANALCI